MTNFPLLRVIIIVTSVEFYFIVFTILLLLVLNQVIKYKNKRDEEIKRKISSALLKAVEEERSYTPDLLPTGRFKPEVLLLVIEDISSKFSGEHWENIKKILLDKYLFSCTRKWAQDKRWLKRHFVARCFALGAHKEDEDLIIKLLNDKVPLIRITAAISAIAIASVPLLLAFFDAMKKEPERGRYAYRDAVLKGQSHIFSWIREQLKIEEDIAMRYIYLDILGAKYDSFVLRYIHKDLQHKEDKLRLKAVKILTNFPTKEALELFLPFLEDHYYLIRAEVIAVLPKIMGQEALPILTKTMQDKSWWVRLQAALGLKSLGNEGKSVLMKEESQEVAKYVLSLP